MTTLEFVDSILDELFLQKDLFDSRMLDVSLSNSPTTATNQKDSAYSIVNLFSSAIDLSSAAGELAASDSPTYSANAKSSAYIIVNLIGGGSSTDISIPGITPDDATPAKSTAEEIRNMSVKDGGTYNPILESEGTDLEIRRSQTKGTNKITYPRFTASLSRSLLR